MIQAGELDHEIRIYRKVGVKDAYGEIQYEDELFDTDWAKREDLTTVKDNERVMDKAQRITFGITKWTFRYRNDLRPTMFFKDEEDAIFEIVGEPIMIGRRHFVAFNTESRDND
jgi:head-tail adaptor